METLPYPVRAQAGSPEIFGHLSSLELPLPQDSEEQFVADTIKEVNVLATKGSVLLILLLAVLLLLVTLIF